jgi:hypothetical protein
MRVNSGGDPQYRAIASYHGYNNEVYDQNNNPEGVVVKLVKGNENGAEVDLPSGSGERYSSYNVSSVGYNAMIINFYYHPNLHHISYKYGKGSSNIGENFETASLGYYYNQSLANANVNQDAAVAATPPGHSFAGWYENPDGVGNRFNFNSTMPDGDIVGGYGDLYLLAERAGMYIGQSEHVRYIEDQTVFKATARYDGEPVIPAAFVAIGISGTKPSSTAVTFAEDKANAAG